jgi:antagonist of KipI
VSAARRPSCELPDFELLADDAWLLRLGARIDPALNARVHRLAAAIRADAPAWLRDLVPAYASLGVFFDPDLCDAGAVRRQLAGFAAALADPDADDVAGRTTEIPVAYGGAHGPDLDAAARELGMNAQALVERHAAGDYTVAMIGFAPGFPYLSGLDPALALPRLATPRTRVPAGSVAIGGAQTGIYPRESPGGWRILGRTPRRLFDPRREQRRRIAPGDRVRFLPIDADAFEPEAQDEAAAAAAATPATALEVLAPGLLTTVQDPGRCGWRHLGVGCAGALDREAAALANAMAGNPADAAVLEISLQGPALRLPRPLRIAICGGAVDARFEDAHGRRHAIPSQRPVDLPAGIVHLAAVVGGMRAWMAVAGGIDLPMVLGSRSTDLRGGFGGLHGRQLRRGDRLPLGSTALARTAPAPADAPLVPGWWIDPWADLPPATPIRFVPSTHPAARDLAARDWHVDPHSNRQGLRLAGTPLAQPGGDGVSEAVAPGTVQLPPDGQPIVLLADAQTTGGYPRLGHVASADLPRLAQARPGDRLRFEAVDAAGARRLREQRRAVMARLQLALAARLR